jgi:general secretion pathway protein K
MTRARGGFALLAALWLLVALSVASLGLSVLAHERRLAAANLVEHTQALAAAQAGVEQLRSRLARRLTLSQELRSAPDVLMDPWHGVDSVLSDTLALGDARVSVTARDVGGQLNLNRATEDELRRLFDALRIDAGEADRLAQCILDWRDADDLHRARGAERDAYVAAGAAVLPRNGSFQTFPELRSVLGMTPDVYERVHPYLTLFGSGQVNLNTADRAVLLALPGMTEEAVVVLARYRRQHRRLASLTDLERDLSPGARRVLERALPELLPQVTTEVREVTVESVGFLPGSPVVARVTGLLVRAGGTVFYVWSRAE